MNAIAQLLEQAQTLGRQYASKQLAQLERSWHIGSPSRLLGRAGNLLDRAIQWSRDLFLSNDQADAQALEDIAERVSETLASTETTDVIEETVMDELQAAGTKKKSWNVEPGACELCTTNAEAGAIPIGQAFPSGHQRAPGHERCRCHVDAE